MRASRRRVAIALASAVLLVACAADHAAPRVASPFDPPSTTLTSTTTTTTIATASSDVADPDEPERADRGEARGRTAGPDTTEAEQPDTIEPSTTVAPSTTAAVDRWAMFDAALSSRLIGGGDYAVGVAVAVDGAIVHTADFGYRVPPPFVPPPAGSSPTVPPTAAVDSTTTTAVPGPPAEPIEVGDRFRIASISKVITAIVVLQLVEAGQIGLDEPVGQRLADIVGTPLADPQAAAITVRQLLAHTSGLASYESTFFRARVDSCAAAGQYGLSRGLSAPPGAQYIYSNLNYCLLGLLVEGLAGRPYEAVVTDRLLAPLGIVGMRLATTYDPDPAHVVHPSAPLRNYMEVLGAAGSWVATPSDVVTIMASLDPTSPGFHPLSPGVVALMRTPVVTAARPDPARGYGLGVMVFGVGAFGHTGTVENTHAMVVSRADGVTWSVLVSGEYPGDTGSLAGIFDRSIEDAGVTFG